MKNTDCSVPPADAKVIYRGEVKWLHDDGEVTSEPTAFV